MMRSDHLSPLRSKGKRFKGRYLEHIEGAAQHNSDVWFTAQGLAAQLGRPWQASQQVDPSLDGGVDQQWKHLVTLLGASKATGMKGSGFMSYSDITVALSTNVIVFTESLLASSNAFPSVICAPKLTILARSDPLVPPIGF